MGIFNLFTLHQDRKRNRNQPNNQAREFNAIAIDMNRKGEKDSQ